MSARIEFFFDYGSPFSYLANALLPGIASLRGRELVYRPFLLGGVFKATGNRSPMAEPVDAKRAYGGLTLTRAVERYGVAFKPNPFFPIDTLATMRMACAAQADGTFETFHAAVYPAFWRDGLDMGDPEVAAGVLTAAGLDAQGLAERSGREAVKQHLRANTEEAIARGAFGAPTVFYGDEMFFGADHLDFLDRRLEDEG